ncbi:MAG: SLBB domain-containing protein [Candidatus Cloacimonas sp.]|jgi:protein involved in polysaccharide export with SLBB domain|nr:SLBB domain-containing protein [Candidatus Cloacimonas sp.]
MRIKLSRYWLVLLLLVTIGLLEAVELPVNTAVPMISVSLTGFVENPGVYQLSPINRLSDLLLLDEARSIKDQFSSEMPDKQAKLFLTPSEVIAPTADVPDYKAFQALRSVQIIRGNSKESYDLLKFYRLGEISQNPFLRDGDVVLISAIQEFISINGGINLPGDVEFVAGDKLSEIISLGKGLSFDADPAKLTVYRYQPNRIDYTIIKVDLNSPQGKEFTLQADDRILIPQDAEITSKQRVKISGQVKNPGEYIINNNTSLYELMLQAGGLTARADIKSLVYYSENISNEPNHYLELLMTRTMSDMTPVEYSYLRSNLLQLKGKYSINANKLAESEGKEANPLLHDGDHIYIPEKMDMVLVSGQVRYPGLVSWSEGKNWDYYIKAAGGYANNRKTGKGKLIRSQSGNWVTPKKDVPIMPGDTVFVPGQTDRSLWTDVKDIVTLSSSLITIIIGLRALSK